MTERTARFACIAIFVAGIVSVIGVRVWRGREHTETVSMRRNRFKSMLADIKSSDHIQPPLPGDGGDKWSWMFRIGAANYPMPRQPEWDQPWNSPGNIKFQGIGLSSYCRDDFSPVAVSIRGADTALEHGFEKLPSFPPNLIILIETPKSALHWMEPGDIDLEELVTGEGRSPGSDSGSDFHVGFADGAVWRMKQTLPLDKLRPFLTLSAAKMADREKLLGEWRL